MTDPKARLSGVIAMVLYIVVFALTMVFTRCESAPPIDEEDLTQGSILISFGDGNEGSGELKRSEVEPVVESPPTPEPEPIEEEILTDERSDVETSKPEADQPKEVITPPREVNKRALFPGSSDKGAKSQGVDEQESKVAGSDRGTSDSANALLGGGLSGDFDLAGRTLMGRLPKPDYGEQEEGRVVIEIFVDEAGRVKTANNKPALSTTNNSHLIEAARKAALQARFSPSESFEQRGTITYNFKLN